MWRKGKVLCRDFVVPGDYGFLESCFVQLCIDFSRTENVNVHRSMQTVKIQQLMPVAANTKKQRQVGNVISHLNFNALLRSQTINFKPPL